VEAEKAQVLQQNEKARKHYQQAITRAKKQGFLHEEALAYELRAQFALQNDDEVNLDQLIESIVEEQSEVFKEQKVKVRLNLRGQGVRIKGHETNFHTVINNLVLNARDALIDSMNQDKEGAPGRRSSPG